MEKVDRLGWTAGFAFTSYGVRVGVRVNDPAVLDRLPDLLPPGWKLSRSPIVERLYSLMVGGEGPRPNLRRFHLLYGNDAKVARSLDLAEVLELFESDLQLYVAEMTPRRVFVHAGVVGWKGRAIVIPGRSFTGKTTLVAELLRAGATYYSDEYAVLDSRGRVHPYARPLSMRKGGTREQQKWPVQTLGGPAGAKPLPVGLVIVTYYKSGAQWRPRRLSPGKGALALLDNTISIQRQPGAALPALTRVAAQAMVLKGARGEAKEIADSILETLS